MELQEILYLQSHPQVCKVTGMVTAHNVISKKINKTKMLFDQK